MRRAQKWCLLVVILVLLALPGRVGALDNEKDFQSISKMSFKEVTERAKAVLEKKYPGEKWEKYKFPKYVYINDSVLVSYKIAVKEWDLLAKFPCYCFCEATGHKNLAYCFLKNGVMGQFDDHASGCNVCDAEAMNVFLWNKLGIPLAKMLKGVKENFGE